VAFARDSSSASKLFESGLGLLRVTPLQLLVTRRRYVYAYYLPEKGNYRAHFEMQQTELERQTEELAELLERDVQEIKRMQVVQSFQMAKKRLKNLMEIVATEQQAGTSGASRS